MTALLVAIVSLVLSSGTASAHHELLSISPGGPGAPRTPDSLLRRVDPTTGATIAGAGVSITLPGFTVTGGTGLARHPSTGDLYALLKVSGSSFRRLATVDEFTGMATDIGNTFRRFAAIAFDSSGTLWALTGDGDGVPETLFLLNPIDATSILVAELGAGSDGETMAYNPDDGLIYHASGIGTQNHPNGERFESVELATYGTSSITLSGYDYEELNAIVYADGAFYAGDVGNSGADDPHFMQIQPNGLVTVIGDMDHVSKGLVVASHASVVPLGGAAAGALLAIALTLVAMRSVSDRKLMDGTP